jgi:hypothetical protein
VHFIVEIIGLRAFWKNALLFIHDMTLHVIGVMNLAAFHTTPSSCPIHKSIFDEEFSAT